MFEPDWEPLLKDADEHGKTNGLIRGLAYAVRYLMGCREELRHTNGMLAGLLIAPDHRSPYGHGAPLPPPPQPPQMNRLDGKQYTHSTVTEQLRDEPWGAHGVAGCEWPDCNCATVDNVPVCDKLATKTAELVGRLGQDHQAVEKALEAGFDAVRDQRTKTWDKGPRHLEPGSKWNDAQQRWELE